MSSQPPWMNDATPPWEIDDTAEQGPPTNEAGFMTAAKTAPIGSAERERALNMALRMGEPSAAGTALALTGAIGGLPIGKAAAIRAGYGLLGASAGGYGGKLVGQGLEAAGAPKVTSEITGVLGGLLGGGVGAVKGKQALESVAALAPGSSAARVLKFLAGGTKKAPQNIAREVEAAATAARVSKAVPKAAEAAKATRTAVPTAATLAPEEQQIVLQIQQQIKTPAGRATVRQWLQTQPPEVQNQVKALLERGLAQPGTTASGGVRSVPRGPAIPEGYGSELAKLLGQ